MSSESEATGGTNPFKTKRATSDSLLGVRLRVLGVRLRWYQSFQDEEVDQ